jgi:hypothetical protein
MSYKHSTTINKAWFHVGAASFSPANIIAKLKNAVTFDIPTGYQDESGFHAGVKPAESEIKWPTTW